jgi:hypothetical protein
MLTANEKKTLSCCAIFLATFLTMCESQEAKEELLRQFEVIKVKVLDDINKKAQKGAHVR